MKYSSLYEALKNLIAIINRTTFESQLYPKEIEQINKAKQALSAYSNTPESADKSEINYINDDLVGKNIPKNPLIGNKSQPESAVTEGIKIGDYIQSESFSKHPVKVTEITKEGDYVTDEYDLNDFMCSSYYVVSKDKAVKSSHLPKVEPVTDREDAEYSLRYSLHDVNSAYNRGVLDGLSKDDPNHNPITDLRHEFQQKMADEAKEYLKIIEELKYKVEPISAGEIEEAFYEQKFAPANVTIAKLEVWLEAIKCYQSKLSQPKNSK